MALWPSIVAFSNSSFNSFVRVGPSDCDFPQPYHHRYFCLAVRKFIFGLSPSLLSLGSGGSFLTSARIPSHQVHFLSLPTAIFCVQCELISANSTTCCLACGSKAVLSLSRLLGGSLRRQARARVIHDDELNRLVRELLHTVPGSELEADRVRHPNSPARHHARVNEDTEIVHNAST